MTDDKEGDLSRNIRYGEINRVSGLIWQDMSDSISYHLGEDSIIEDPDKLLCSTIAIANLINQICHGSSNKLGKRLQFHEMLEFLLDLEEKQQEVDRKEIK